MLLRRLLVSSVTLFLATTICCASSLGLTSEYEDELRPSFVSRRAIDGTRGRKYFNPQEDGFFDDYGYERGQYYGSGEKQGIAGLRSNVPGEPGVDYPAYEKIPRTTFSCFNRERGYYADEEAGCQLFHVCDEGLVSSFLCPVGSLFSQRLLTCDWWLKVPCSRSRDFYHEQFHADDVSLASGDIVRHALTESTKYPDQDRDQDKTVPVVVQKNINQLDQDGFKRRNGGSRNRVRVRVDTRERDDMEIVRIKTIDDQVDRRTRLRGESSFRSSASADSKCQRRRLSHDSHSQFPSPATKPTTVTTSTTTTTTTTVTPIVTEASRIFQTSSEDSAATTVAPVYETTSASAYYQDTTSLNLLTDVPTKRGLEEVDPVTTRPTIGSHNSAYEYDDMEGKESIGLVNSHVERNLERNANKVRAMDRNGDSDTTLEFFESITPTVTEKVEQATQLDENIQARESIGLVQSKVQERFQLFNDNQKVVAAEILSGNGEVRTDETVIPVVDDNHTESPTLLQSNSTEYAQNGNTETVYQTEVTDIYTDMEAGKMQSVQPVRTQEVRKMSGFLINVTEKKPTERTTLPAETVYPTEYHELLNSSDTTYTSTIPAWTQVSNNDEQATTISNSIKRVSDTVEESNAPFEVTLTLNANNTLNGGHGPIGAELLGQLISQHVDEPISLNDVQIVKSDQVGQDASVAQNQQHASNTVSGVRTYQNFRSYHHQPTTTRIYDNHRSQPTVTPNFRNYQNHQVETENPVPTTTQAPTNYVRYQHQPNQNIEFRPYQAKQVAEFHTTTNQQLQPTTTHAPQQNYWSHQNYKDESKGFNSYQPFQEQPKQFKDAIIQNVISTTARNNLASEEESLKFKNYEAVKKESINVKDYQNQPNEQNIYKNHQTSNNEPEDYQKYHVNYQTHHYPENFPTHQKNQQDFGNYKTKNYFNHQNTNNFNNYRNQQSNDNSQNSENHEINYSDYQNYDSVEDIVGSPQFSEFGTRLAAKNPFLNTVNKKSKINEDANAHMINAGLQGKAANFLWAMSQLAKNDRFPRPFTQNSDKSTENNLSTPNKAFNSNSVIDVHNKARNNNDENINKFRQPTVHNNNHYDNNNNYRENKTETTNNYNNNNNYNGNYNSNIQQNFEDEYIVDVDEFAAPRTDPIPKSIYNQNHSDRFNQKDDSLDTVPSTYISKNQSNYNRPRQDRILNTKPGPPKTENHPQFVKIPQPNYNTYNGQSTPEVNTVPFNNNQQFVQIPQPDYNEYNIENTQVPQHNIPTSNTPQSHPIDYTLDDSTQSTTESSSGQENYQIFQSHQPQNLDFNFQHGSRPTIPPTRVPNKNVEIVNSPQPDSVHNPFLYSTPAPADDSHKSNENFHAQHNLQLQQQPVDYNFHHSIESSYENSQHNSQSSHENTNVPNHHFQNVNTQSQPQDYNFQHSIESSVEHSQVPNENYHTPETTQPQPVDYTFQHPLPSVEHSPVPTQNYQNQQNTRPEQIDYSFPHNIQSSGISIPSPYKSIQILTNLHRQQADYNFQHSTPLPVKNTQVPHKNIPIQPHSQPQPNDYQFHKSTSSYVESTPVPDRNTDQPPPIDYSYQHSTPSSEENSYVSNENYHSAEGAQSQSGEYNFEQSSELSHEDNQNVRFPDNFPQQQPADHTYYESTPSSVENSQAQHENYRTFPTSVSNFNLHSSSQQSSVESSQPLRPTQPQSIDFNFQPTVPPSTPSEETSTQDSRYQNYNVTKTLTKTTVETEFIPSLSFDFGSDEGRKEYLEALEKGLVPNDSVAKDASASASVEAEQTTISVEESDRRDRSRKSEESNNSSTSSSNGIKNFKDTIESMSGEE